jgi:hypothetical protein
VARSSRSSVAPDLDVAPAFEQAYARHASTASRPSLRLVPRRLVPEELDDLRPTGRTELDGLPLSSFERRVARACDGSRRLADLAELRGLPVSTRRAIVTRLVAFEAIELRGP